MVTVPLRICFCAIINYMLALPVSPLEHTADGQQVASSHPQSPLARYQVWCLKTVLISSKSSNLHILLPLLQCTQFADQTILQEPAALPV
jgi:hypothetical protein